MSIVNRRNAMLGWMTWQMGKRVVTKKAKGIVPSSGKGGSGSGSGKKKAVKTAAIVAAVGAVVFWKAKHRDSTDHDSVASEELGEPDT